MALVTKAIVAGRFHVGENILAFLRGGMGKGKVRTSFASTFLEIYQGPMHSACIQSHYRIKMPYCSSKSAGYLALRRLNFLFRDLFNCVVSFSRSRGFLEMGHSVFVWPAFTISSNTLPLKWPTPTQPSSTPAQKCNATGSVNVSSFFE